jgi:hypothetical protein
VYCYIIKSSSHVSDLFYPCDFTSQYIKMKTSIVCVFQLCLGTVVICAITAYHYLSCEFEPCSWRGVLDTTLYDKVCQWPSKSRWFSPGTPVSFTNKTDRNDITEVLLKVALNTINQTKPIVFLQQSHMYVLCLPFLFHIIYVMQFVIIFYCLPNVF